MKGRWNKGPKVYRSINQPMTVSVEKAECKLSGAYSFTVHFTSQMEEMKKSDHIAVQWMYGENTFEFYSWNIRWKWKVKALKISTRYRIAIMIRYGNFITLWLFQQIFNIIRDNSQHEFQPYLNSITNFISFKS